MATLPQAVARHVDAAGLTGRAARGGGLRRTGTPSPCSTLCTASETPTGYLCAWRTWTTASVPRPRSTPASCGNVPRRSRFHARSSQ